MRCTCSMPASYPLRIKGGGLDEVTCSRALGARRRACKSYWAAASVGAGADRFAGSRSVGRPAAILQWVME
jgi:hypothetical protein